MAKNILVTGGAGFIGSHLVDRLLTDGHNVTVIDNFSTGRPRNLAHQEENRNLEVIQADISDFDSIKKYFKGKNIVFHLAALADIVPSIENPMAYYKSNVSGTISVVESARLAGIEKLVYTASSSCYGIPAVYPTPETSEISLQYPYALTKYLGEHIVLHWGKIFKLPVISFRLFNVFGPRSRTSGTYGAVFGVFLAQKLNNMPFTIVSDGTQTRDFTFVSDVVEAFICAAHSDIEDEIFNVGSGKPQSVNNLVSLLGGEKVYIPKRPGEPDCTWADITKIKAMIGWQPRISFEEGVRIMLENIDYWKEAPLWTPENIEEATKSWFNYLSE